MRNGKIVDFREVVWIVHVEDGNGAARAGHVDAAHTGIELDDIRTGGHWKQGDHAMRV